MDVVDSIFGFVSEMIPKRYCEECEDWH